MDSKLDMYIVYQFLKRLSTPFEKWRGYDLGIIDKDGNILRQYKELSDEERKDWTHFDILITNLKKELTKVSGGKQKMSSMIMALYFLRELKGKKAVSSEQGAASTKGQVLHWARMRDVKEDVAVSNVGAGQVAGLGVGPQGEPPVKKRLKLLKRVMPSYAKTTIKTGSLDTK